MGALAVYAFIGISCLLGIFRPFYGLCGYLFLVFLQPEWIWRFDGLVGLQYQKPLVICILIGTALSLSNGNGIFGNRSLVLSSIVILLTSWISLTMSSYTWATTLYFDILWKSILIMIASFHLVDSPKKAIAIGIAITAGTFYNALRLNLDYLEVGWCRWIRDSWGYKGDSNVICLFVMPAIAFSAVLLFTMRSRLLQLASVASLMVHVHMVFILESRGAMLGLGLLFFIAFLMIPKSPAMIGSVVIVGLGVAWIAGPPVIREFSSIFVDAEERDASAESRFMLWKAAFRIGMDNPIFGVGPYSGQFLIPQYEPAFAGQAAKHPHNIFMEIFSGIGAFGLTAYVALILSPVLMAFRLRRQYDLRSDPMLQTLTIWPSAGIPAMALTGMFCGSGMMESMYYFVGISLGSLVAYKKYLDESESLEIPLEIEEFVDLAHEDWRQEEIRGFSSV